MKIAWGEGGTMQILGSDIIKKKAPIILDCHLPSEILGNSNSGYENQAS